MDIQLMKEDGQPWGPWFSENAIQRIAPVGHRLSGASMRNTFSMRTGPGIPTISVALTKGGMISQL
ncbi:hypothetical protein N7495_005726 [Penicillium taxi]|uniref:uncharacterized protein n=1 Tax=Penicillium taxi TaxID=168475 RepID=UPI002544DB00|nr:uncharacterized protein N7495_005726 [Penicillium taxi]KAJ5894035.1 hypothetical protein N7495_005726 [Penicillium taxi]